MDLTAKVEIVQSCPAKQMDKFLPHGTTWSAPTMGPRWPKHGRKSEDSEVAGSPTVETVEIVEAYCRCRDRRKTAKNLPSCLQYVYSMFTVFCGLLPDGK